MCTYRFQFEPEVSLTEAEQTLHLALFAVEGLFGEARVRLEGSYRVDERGDAILVNGGSDVGDAVVKVFTGLLLREFGADAFQVRPIPAAKPEPVAVPA
jgi:hypothetical protein